MNLGHRRIIKCKQGDNLAEFTLRIDGMHCGSCIRRVTQTLAATEGIQVEEVRLGAARVTAPSDDHKKLDDTLARLQSAGYPAHLESSVA